MALTTRKPVAFGDVIGGKYRVEREIGQGGVGRVVQARHLELQLTVAIKILLRDEAEQVARFMREARAAVRLRGEHVAKVTDVGRLADGTPYMVMEFLEGENLGSVTERGPLSIDDATTYFLQACEGVAEAHALGIVHRDIKPANLFLTQSARGRPLVKVLDFGIAKGGGAAGDDVRLTGELAVFGSPPYMSPEQVRASRDVDCRSDIWSLGVSLYELLTGRVPFDGETAQDICAQVLTAEPPPMARWRPAVPEGLERVVARCLAKSAADRFQSVWELAVAVEPFASAAARNAERIHELLFTPPPSGWQASSAPSPAQGANANADTHGAFTSGALRPRRRTRIAILVAVGALALIAVMVSRFGHSVLSGPAMPQGGKATAATQGPPSAPDPATAVLPVLPQADSPAPVAAPSVTTSARPAPAPVHLPPRPKPTNQLVHPESTKM
jgi:eukaryotic-like serine/threonine-protein kinase